MGLDQEVYSIDKNTDVIECIADWRNNGRLQEWMECKHGEIIHESSLRVDLDMDDILLFEKDVNDYPTTPDDYNKNFAAFVESAKECLNDGKELYYSCCW